MLAYVINMDRSPERMSRMAQMLTHLGVTFVRVPAVDGRKLSPPAGIAPGYYGNFLSHVKCWEMIAAGSAPSGLCLEDDVVFARNFATLWSDSRLGDIADLLRLEICHPKRVTLGKKKASLDGAYGAYPLRSDTCGTAAYIVTKAGADWLLKNAHPTKNIDLVVFGDLIDKNLEILTVNPAPCAQYHMVAGLPVNPAVTVSTLDRVEPIGFVPEPPFRLSAGMKLIRLLANAFHGQRRIKPAFHPSGPIDL